MLDRSEENQCGERTALLLCDRSHGMEILIQSIGIKIYDDKITRILSNMTIAHFKQLLLGDYHTKIRLINRTTQKETFRSSK